VQDPVVAVLHGQVEVRHDAGPRPALDEPVVHVGRMQVHRTDPRHPRLAERQEKIGDITVARQVAAVG
jgi:hypothetical protein